MHQFTIKLWSHILHETSALKRVKLMTRIGRPTLYGIFCIILWLLIFTLPRQTLNNIWLLFHFIVLITRTYTILSILFGLYLQFKLKFKKLFTSLSLYERYVKSFVLCSSTDNGTLWILAYLFKRLSDF